MDKNYCVVLRAKSLVKLFEEENCFYNIESLKGRPIKAQFYDWMESIQGRARIHQGIEAEIHLNQHSLDDAIGEAIYIAEPFLILASFTTNAKSEPFKPFIAYNVTPGIQNREFRQYFYDVAKVHTSDIKRNLPIEKFQKVLDGVKKEKFPPQERLGRAIYWYWKSLSERDLWDQFLALWIGLEALNNLIQKKYSLEKGEKKQCPQCGYEFDTPSITGIRYVMHNHLENGEKKYRIARKVRACLVHSSQNLYELQKEVKDSISNLRETFLKSFLLLSNIPQEEWDQWLVEPATQTEELCVEIEGFLLEENLTKLTDKEHPHFDLNLAKTGDKTGVNFLSMRFKWFGSCPFIPHSARIKGPSVKEQTQIEAFIEDQHGEKKPISIEKEPY